MAPAWASAPPRVCTAREGRKSVWVAVGGAARCRGDATASVAASGGSIRGSRAEGQAAPPALLLWLGASVAGLPGWGATGTLGHGTGLLGPGSLPSDVRPVSGLFPALRVSLVSPPPPNPKRPCRGKAGCGGGDRKSLGGQVRGGQIEQEAVLHQDGTRRRMERGPGGQQEGLLATQVSGPMSRAPLAGAPAWPCWGGCWRPPGSPARAPQLRGWGSGRSFLCGLPASSWAPSSPHTLHSVLCCGARPMSRRTRGLGVQLPPCS